MPYAALLLDFYGTLVEEDDPIITRIASQVAAFSPLAPCSHEVGSRWWELMGGMVNTAYGTTFHLQREIELDSLSQLLREYQANLDPLLLSQPIFDYWQHPRAYPDAAALVEHSPVPICIVSNIDNADVHSALGFLNWRVPLIVTSETCRAYKPRAEMFDTALQLLGIIPSQALHVGDSINSDVKGAQRAGVAVAWVNRHGKSAPDPAPTHVISSLSDLLELL
jgi:HAD superfamily hydrolase (TIGR01549 family)